MRWRWGTKRQRIVRRLQKGIENASTRLTLRSKGSSKWPRNERGIDREAWRILTTGSKSRSSRISTSWILKRYKSIDLHQKYSLISIIARVKDQTLATAVISSSKVLPPKAPRAINPSLPARSLSHHPKTVNTAWLMTKSNRQLHEPLAKSYKMKSSLRYTSLSQIIKLKSQKANRKKYRYRKLRWIKTMKCPWNSMRQPNKG